MSSQQPDRNFNREIEEILEKAEKRVEELKDLRRNEIRPWEKERLFRSIKELEEGRYSPRRHLTNKLTDLEAEIKRLFSEIVFSSSMALLVCVLFGWLLWMLSTHSPS